MSAPRYDAVLFDMDGTLLHTAPDISAALNRALVDNGHPALDIVQVTGMIGRGPRVLIERALGAHGRTDADAGEVEHLYVQYVDHYMAMIGTHSDAFPGARECLVQLRADGLRLGVVTNALQKVATALLARFDLLDAVDIVVGGDQVTHTKPHPEHVLAACRMLGVDAQRTLFVGDSNNDVRAATAAHVDIVGVPHGYNEGQPAEALGCPLIASFADLPDYIRAQSSTACAT